MEALWFESLLNMSHKSVIKTGNSTLLDNNDGLMHNTVVKVKNSTNDVMSIID